MLCSPSCPTSPNKLKRSRLESPGHDLRAPLPHAKGSNTADLTEQATASLLVSAARLSRRDIAHRLAGRAIGTSAAHLITRDYGGD